MRARACVQVPACSTKGSWSEVCKFGATSRGDFICVGNTQGDVRVYNTTTGRQVALVSPIKVRTPYFNSYTLIGYCMCSFARTP